MDEFFNSSTGPAAAGTAAPRLEPDGDDLAAVATALAAATRPLLVLGTDVWADRAEEAALRFVEALGIPTITNGMGRGIVPGGHPLLVTKARGAAINGADLVVVVGTPLDFRLGYGVFGGKDGATPARVVHVADSPGQLSAARHAGRLGRRRPVLGLRRAARAGAARAGAATGPRGRPSSATSSRRPSPATTSCSPPRPTRSTRPASTASWCPGWPTTRSSSATAATSSASPASSWSRSVPAAGSTRAPTAAWAPAWAPPSPPGWRARRRRSPCCWATGPPASR